MGWSRARTEYRYTARRGRVEGVGSYRSADPSHLWPIGEGDTIAPASTGTRVLTLYRPSTSACTSTVSVVR